MGQTNSVQYSVGVQAKKQGETEVRRSLQTVDGLVQAPQEGLNTLQDIWLQSVKTYGKRPFLSTRGKDKKYQSKTYEEIHEMSKHFGAGMVHLNLAPEVNEYSDFKLRLVGIYSKNREEWSLADIGCGMLYGMTLVPLYDTLGPENLNYCINHSNMQVIIAASGPVDTLLKTEGIQCIKTIIAIDSITTEQQQKASEQQINLITLQSVINEGKAHPSEYASLTKDSIFTFSYTSGTTGKPKAAMLSHGNFTSGCGVFHKNPSLKKFIVDSHLENIPIIHLSYLPLPHVFERFIFISLTHLGGQIYYYQGDVNKIKEDLSEVRPTIFVSVPRLYNKFYDKIKEQFDKYKGLKRAMIDIALQSKLNNVNNYAIYDHQIWDQLVFKKIREDVFGGRVRLMITGSAPISKDVLNFMQVCASCPMLEGYGSTETTAASFTKYHFDPESGHVGGPCANIEYKLEDIPEMNYLSTDVDKQGNSEPRGEICMRGPGIFVGYYKDEEKTKEAIDKDGWLHTGDVGLIAGKNSHLRIIDRKKNIFKLSQGEYVAPEKIENIYLKVKGISEIFVYGDSLQSTLVAIIVPEKEYIISLGKELNIDGSYEELCASPAIRQHVNKLIMAQGKQDKLFGFEQARNVHIEPHSLANKGCYTSTMKLQRHSAKIAMQGVIDSLYKEIEATQ